MYIMASEAPVDYAWVSGGDPAFSHIDGIDSGWGGEVHKAGSTKTCVNV